MQDKKTKSCSLQDEGTKSKLNKSSKKNGLVILISDKLLNWVECAVLAVVESAAKVPLVLRTVAVCRGGV
jgi:hypothetical protein